MYSDQQKVPDLEGKEEELLGYLLVHRARPHPRESLASLLWSESTTSQSRKYLRQALWHLHQALEIRRGLPANAVIEVEHDWVQINRNASIQIDIAEFERASAQADRKPAVPDEAVAETLKKAVELYRGDFLEGSYQDWCLFERERLQNIYLSMLDKLMLYSIEHREFEGGREFGTTILRYDRASERTHRQLMKLYYLSGDRTAALRQYQRCVAALDEELGVKPDHATQVLYEAIRADKDFLGSTPVAAPAASLPEVVTRLKRLHTFLGQTKRRIRREIAAVEGTLRTTKE